MNIRDLIRARMARVTGGGGGVSRVAPSRDPRSSSPGSSRDVEMAARNARMARPSGTPGGRGVPGLPGMRFADDYASGLQTGIASHQLWHSPDRGSHPAIEWSRNQAGIANQAASPLIDATHARLAEKGITKKNDSWTIGGRDLASTAGLAGPAAKIPVSRPNPTNPLAGTIATGVKSALGLGGSQPSVPAPTPTTLGGGIRQAVELAISQARTPVQRPIPAATPPATGTAPTTPATPTAGQPAPVQPAPGRPPSAAPGLPAAGDPAVTQLPGANAAPNGRDPITGQPLPPPVIATPINPGGGPAAAPAAAPAPAGPGSLTTPIGGEYAIVDANMDAINQASAESGVPANILAGMMMIESGGVDQTGQCRADGSCGNMQVKPAYHSHRIPGCGEAEIINNTNNCNVRVAAHIMAEGAAQCGGDYDCALTTLYFPTDDVMNGTTQGGYLEALHQHMATIDAAQGTAAPAGGQPAVVGTTNDPNQGAIAGTTNAPVEVTGPYQPGTMVPPTPENKANGTAGLPVGPDGMPQMTVGRPPNQTGTIAPAPTPSGGQGMTVNGPVTQGDGLGIYAGADADESWINDMFPGGEGSVSTDYKQDVCTYNPDCCNGGPDCWYDSNLKMAGASNTVHPGYDIAAPAGTTFHAPMGGQVLGTKYAANNDPRCITPDGLNHCTWAADDGIVVDGGVDAQGNQIFINYDHAIPDTSLVGQYVEQGTPLGQVNGEDHIHVEIHGYCPALGKSVVLDPSLVYGGYYQTHSVCEGVA